MQFSNHEDESDMLENIDLNPNQNNKYPKETYKESEQFDTLAFEETKSKINNKYDPKNDYSSDEPPKRNPNTKITKITPDDYSKMFKRDSTMWHLTIAQPGMKEKGLLLQRLFTVFKFGGLLYSTSRGEWSNWNETQYSIATAFSHGQNIIIQLPPSEKKDDTFWKWLITGEKSGDLSKFLSCSNSNETEKEKKIIFKRLDEKYGLEHTEPQDLMNNRKKYVSEKIILSNTNETKFHSIDDVNNHKTWGLNIPFGGHQQKNFLNETISANGYHGHIFFHYLPSKNNRNGAILVGLEPCEPGKHSVFGENSNFSSAYGYTWKYLSNGPKDFDSMIIDLPSNWSDIERKSHDFKFEWIYQTSEPNRSDVESVKKFKNESKQVDDFLFSFEVSDPIQKQEENMIGTNYWVYKITSSLDFSKDPELEKDNLYQPVVSVYRRFSDFEWLQNRLSLKFPGYIIPPIPEKTIYSTVEKYVKMESTVTDSRKIKFQLFLKKIGQHKEMRRCHDVVQFLGNPSEVDFKKYQKEKINSELDLLNSKTTYQWISSFFNFSSVKNNEIIDLLQKIRMEKNQYYEKIGKLMESFVNLLYKQEETANIMKDLGRGLKEMSDYQKDKKNELFSYKLIELNDTSQEIGNSLLIFKKECLKYISMMEFQIGILDSIENQIKTQETIKKKIDEESSDIKELSNLLNNVNTRFLKDYEVFQLSNGFELQEIVNGYFKLQFTMMKQLYEKI